jgi:hypothetical protein
MKVGKNVYFNIGIIAYRLVRRLFSNIDKK